MMKRLLLDAGIRQGFDRDLRSLRPEVPESLAAPIARCVSKEREQRFADARALYVALGRVTLS